MSERDPYYPPHQYRPPQAGVEAVSGPDIVGPHAEPPPGPADLFRQMADRIERNDPGEFAGAILIVPPSSEDSPADSVEILIVTPHHDEGHFWAVAKGKVDIEHNRWEQAQSVPRPGGYR